ncbi:MAG: SET domain-containing protein-lysine N-methyltransferase [Parcubacteria group bacterium]|nr:SET domain-containing protein-lysine N-methyltransferase [Parcubacteria group bacterium]
MDLHSDYNHRWITSKAESFSSPIHGLGVVAKEKINKGEIVFVYGGVIVPREDIKEYWKKMGHVGIQIDDDFWVCPTSREELEKQGVINHSCEPNTGFQDQVILVAIKDIEPGEELTFDYAFCESFMESFECKCQSPDCRKTITENDWQIKDLQEEYKDFFSPYIRKKIWS